MISTLPSLLLRPIRLGMLFCAAAAAASAGVVDFEDLFVSAGDWAFANPTTSQGFHLSASLGGYERDADGAYRGSNSFFTDSSPISLTKVGGGAFDLISFWAAEDGGHFARTITLTGFLSGGGTVSTSFNIDGLFDGAGGIDDYQLFTLPASFVGLTSVTFSDPGSDLALDDITVGPLASSVPEPSSLALAGSALLAAGLLRRRSRGRLA